MNTYSDDLNGSWPETSARSDLTPFSDIPPVEPGSSSRSNGSCLVYSDRSEKRSNGGGSSDGQYRDDPAAALATNEGDDANKSYIPQQL